MNIINRIQSQYTPDIEGLDRAKTRYDTMGKSTNGNKTAGSLEKTLKDPLKVNLDQREV